MGEIRDRIRLTKARCKATARVQFVNFKDHDSLLAEKIADQLENLLKRYPKVQDISWISTAQFRNKCAKERMLEASIEHNINVNGLPDTPQIRIRLRNLLEPEIDQLFSPILQGTFAQSTNRGWEDQQGICFNKFWSIDYSKLADAYRKDVELKGSPEGSYDPICIFTHEFGHQIDYYLTENGLRGEIDQLWDEASLSYSKDKDYFKNNLCLNAQKNSKEFLAEGFTEFIHNPHPRSLAAKIGNAIDKAMK